MNDEVKGYEGNKGMSKEETAKRFKEAGGLEAFGFGSKPLQPTEGRVEEDAPRMGDEAREMTLKEWIEQLPPIHRARKEYDALLPAPREQPGQREAAHAVVCPACDHHFFLGCDRRAT